MKSIEAQLQEATASIATLTAKNAELTEAIKNADKTASAAKLATMCKEADLPEPAVKRLQDAFKEAVSDQGMQEAVNTEKKYIESLGVAKKIVRNNGGGSAVAESDKNTSELKESQFNSLVASGFDEKTAASMSGHKAK